MSNFQSDYSQIIAHIFKAYDVRGVVERQLDGALMYAIFYAFFEYLNQQESSAQVCDMVVIAHDARASGPFFAKVAQAAANDLGLETKNLGLAGTEEMYFATQGALGGVCITASHNPIDYNGIKFALSDGAPVNSELLNQIAQRAQRVLSNDACARWKNIVYSNVVLPLLPKTAYINHLMSKINPKHLKPIKIVVNAGGGAAGAVLDLLQAQILAHCPDFQMIKIHHEPDPNFKNGVPNPMLKPQQFAMGRAVRAHGAVAGFAFDGDFDRCFLFDGGGEFVEGAQVVALLIRAFLSKHQGAAVVYDGRVVYPCVDMVKSLGGVGHLSRTGHSFIKQKMREVGAIYGGEMSAHHYYQDFLYCDSGMMTFLLILELICQYPLDDLLRDIKKSASILGEQNFSTDVPFEVVKNALIAHYPNACVSTLDGVAFDFDDWRFNVRASNTEPLLRLNLEVRGDEALLKMRHDEVLAHFADLGIVGG